MNLREELNCITHAAMSIEEKRLQVEFEEKHRVWVETFLNNLMAVAKTQAREGRFEAMIVYTSSNHLPPIHGNSDRGNFMYRLEKLVVEKTGFSVSKSNQWYTPDWDRLTPGSESFRFTVFWDDPAPPPVVKTCGCRCQSRS